LKAVDNNTTITGTFTLSQGWQKCLKVGKNVLYRQTTLEKLAQSDEAAMF
jgi:hypothetical protein